MTLDEAIAAALDLDRRGCEVNAAIRVLRAEYKARTPGHPLDNAWRLSGSTVWRRIASELQAAQKELAK